LLFNPLKPKKQAIKPPFRLRLIVNKKKNQKKNFFLTAPFFTPPTVNISKFSLLLSFIGLFIVNNA